MAASRQLQAALQSRFYSQDGAPTSQEVAEEAGGEQAGLHQEHELEHAAAATVGASTRAGAGAGPAGSAEHGLAIDASAEEQRVQCSADASQGTVARAAGNASFLLDDDGEGRGGHQGTSHGEGRVGSDGAAAQSQAEQGTGKSSQGSGQVLGGMDQDQESLQVSIPTLVDPTPSDGPNQAADGARHASEQQPTADPQAKPI